MTGTFNISCDIINCTSSLDNFNIKNFFLIVITVNNTLCICLQITKYFDIIFGIRLNIKF